MVYSSKFIKFGVKREKIPNITEYLMDIYEKDPNITIAIGCDSIQRRRTTVYANTIVLYNHDIRNGASIIYYKESHPRIKDGFSRLYKEAEYMNKIGTWLHNELHESGFVRNDLDLLERKRYKFSQMIEYGTYTSLPLHEHNNFIEKIHLTEQEINKEYKLIDIHLDLNPVEFSQTEKYNKSYKVYKVAVPWLRGFDFRVYPKALSYAATSAADLLLK